MPSSCFWVWPRSRSPNTSRHAGPSQPVEAPQPSVEVVPTRENVARLAVKNDSLAYLVLVDRSGVVRWLHAGAFDGARAAELDDEIRQLLASA